MDTITTIGIVIATLATGLTGFWFIVKKVFEGGKIFQRFDALEESFKRQENALSSHGEALSKIPLIEARLSSIEENVKSQGDSIKSQGDSIKSQGDSIRKIEETVSRQGDSIRRIEETTLKQGESIRRLEENAIRQIEVIRRIEETCMRHDDSIKKIERNASRQEEIIRNQSESLRRIAENGIRQEVSIKKLDENSNKQQLTIRKMEEKSNIQEFTLKNHDEAIVLLKDTTNVASAWIIKQDERMGVQFLGKRSPYSLKDAGIKLLELSGGKTAVDNNLSFFIDEIKKLNPLTAYDVEEISLRVLITNTGKSIFNSIKDFIYYSPEEIEIAGSKYKIGLNVVLRVMSLHLRDAYLNIFPFENSLEHEQ